MQYRVLKRLLILAALMLLFIVSNSNYTTEIIGAKANYVVVDNQPSTILYEVVEFSELNNANKAVLALTGNVYRLPLISDLKTPNRPAETLGHDDIVTSTANALNVATYYVDISQPSKIQIPANEGGSSAGAPFTLAIIEHNLGSPLSSKYKIAATGELLDFTGELAPISGTHQKIKAASEKGATVFFLPRENYHEIDLKDYSIQIVPVRNVNDILTWLCKEEPGSNSCSLVK